MRIPVGQAEEIRKTLTKEITETLKYPFPNISLGDLTKKTDDELSKLRSLLPVCKEDATRVALEAVEKAARHHVPVSQKMVEWPASKDARQHVLLHIGSQLCSSTGKGNDVIRYELAEASRKFMPEIEEQLKNSKWIVVTKLKDGTHPYCVLARIRNTFANRSKVVFREILLFDPKGDIQRKIVQEFFISNESLIEYNSASEAEKKLLREVVLIQHTYGHRIVDGVRKNAMFIG